MWMALSGTLFDTCLYGSGTCPSWRTRRRTVDERSRVLTATLIGAVAGGVWGWLYLTEHGRRIRDQIEPKLDDFIGEICARPRHRGKGPHRGG